MSGRFVGCDWGTSNLRMRWIDADAERVLAEVSTGEGVKQAHAAWQERGGDRTEAYYGVLSRALARLEERAGEPLDGPVVVSGMASSSIGVEELPYATLPFPLAGGAPAARVLDRPLPGGRRVVLLTGLRSAEDVMRGEETQLIGLWRRLGAPADPSIVLLPGTHSKHVRIEGGAVRDFHTFMTGELFEVAAAHTILRDSVRPGAPSPPDPAAFREGVRAGAGRALANALFLTRTNTLLGRLGPAENRGFLSGVLIGSELAALRDLRSHRVLLCAAGELGDLYEAALTALGVAGFTRLADELVGHSAAWGQLEAFRALGS